MAQFEWALSSRVKIDQSGCGMALSKAGSLDARRYWFSDRLRRYRRATRVSGNVVMEWTTNPKDIRRKRRDGWHVVDERDGFLDGDSVGCVFDALLFLTGSKI